MMASAIVRSKAQNRAICVYIQTRYAATKPAEEIDSEWADAKPYSAIPGPKPLPIPKIGNFWRFLPFGTYGNVSSKDLAGVLHKEFGPLAKLSGMGNQEFIMLYDPEDAEKVFRTEGTWPRRTGNESLDYYRRRTRPDIFGNFLGVLTTQDEEWGKNRSAVNQPMMKPQNIKNYHQPIQTIATEFLARIKNMRDEKQEMPKDFHNELNKWALESISYIALDARLGCLNSNLPADSDGQIMIDAVGEIFELIYKLDVLPSLWRIYSTKDWKRMVKAMDSVTGVSLKHIKNKLKEIEGRLEDEKDGQSILEVLLRGVGGEKSAVTMAIDMMMAGIDTTSNGTAIAWYQLAKNQDAQQKLFEELKQLMPNKSDQLPKDYMSRSNYLKACFKEAQRILPVAAANARNLGKDLVIKGYRVPKGTLMILCHDVMCSSEKHFFEPLKYKPERWLKETEGTPLSAKNAHPFAFLPFGFGPRMCIGRRFAELEMHTITAQVFRNYKVSFNYDEFKFKTSILTQPSTPLRFKLEEREN